MYNWDEKFSVGVQSIDNQHKEMFILLNKLLESMRNGQGATVTTKIILDLEKYAIFHFQKEEYFFKRFGFIGAETHIAEHKQFMQKVTTLKAEIKAGKIMPTMELFNFLKDWIEHHILEVDKEYTACFNQNGLR